MCLLARVKSDHTALWFYPAFDFTSGGFQFWAREIYFCHEENIQVFICEFSTVRPQGRRCLQDPLCKLSALLSREIKREEQYLHSEGFTLAFSGPHFITRTGKLLCMCERAQHNKNRNYITIIISVLEELLPMAMWNCRALFPPAL